MKKITKKIITTAFVLFLSLASIFCCCLTGVAQAGINDKSEQGMAEGSRCCPDKTKSTDSDKTHECKCEKSTDIIPIKGFNLSKAADSLRRILDRFLSSFRKTNIFDQAFVQNHVLREPVQGVKNNPPIYLRDATLRL